MYRGRVTNIMDFGCFVELSGLRSRCEGLVHLANITKNRHAYFLLHVPAAYTVSMQHSC